MRLIILFFFFSSFMGCNLKDSMDSEAEIWLAEAHKERQAQEAGGTSQSNKGNNISKKSNNSSDKTGGVIVVLSDDNEECKSYIRKLESYNNCVELCELARVGSDSLFPCSGIGGQCFKPFRPWGCSIL